MEMREIDAAERASVSLPMQAYAFQATPASDDLVKRLERRQRFYAGNLTLVAEEDGAAVAQVDGLPMRQNVRSVVYPMAGVAGVAGLAGAGGKVAGRIGLKALVWFEVATTVALFIGLGAANLIRPGVGVELFADRLLVDVCREVGADAIVKGLRGGTDFAYELPMALMNRHLTGIETVFLPGDPRFEHISSSLVKEVARYGGDIGGLVSDRVRDALVDRVTRH